MIKFEHTEVTGWGAAIRGVHNPMNFWEKGDSGYRCGDKARAVIDGCDVACDIPHFNIGPNDLDLMKRLRNAGTDHWKFMRMITVYVDITAPLYWWKEFDPNNMVTVANSCSIMHKIAEKEFTLDDFSCECLLNTESAIFRDSDERFDIDGSFSATAFDFMSMTCYMLNFYRKKYLNAQAPEIKRRYWWQIIQLIPSSYNQRQTVMLNYEALANIYKSRKNHKLDEWALSGIDHFITANEEDPNGVQSGRKGFGFCDWITTLPYSELITGEFAND